MLGLILPFAKVKQKKAQKEGNKDKFFKGQQENEELICFFRKHWITVLTRFGFLGLLLLLEVVFVINFPTLSSLIKGTFTVELLFVGIVILATVYLHKLFLRIFNHFLNVVLFTNLHVIEHKKTLFLQDSHEILDIVKVQDVRKSQEGIVKNILRYGDLVITLSSSLASKLLPQVPNVNFHFRCLSRIKREAFLQGAAVRSKGGLGASSSSLGAGAAGAAGAGGAGEAFLPTGAEQSEWLSAGLVDFEVAQTEKSARGVIEAADENVVEK